jgi:hypothetical protein
MPILAILYTAHRGEVLAILFTKPKRYVPRVQGAGFASEPGGIGEVAMLCGFARTITSWAMI